MERICLDTNILIDHKRAKKSAKANTFLFRLASGHSQLAISTITAYELLRGDNQDEDQYWHQMFENLGSDAMWVIKRHWLIVIFGQTAEVFKTSEVSAYHPHCITTTFWSTEFIPFQAA